MSSNSVESRAFSPVRDKVAYVQFDRSPAQYGSAYVRMRVGCGCTPQAAECGNLGRGSEGPVTAMLHRSYAHS